MLAKAQSLSCSRGRTFGLWGIVVIGLTSFGCAESLDALMSRRFRNDPMHVMFGTDDPMYVLRHVEESDARVRAMQDLKEPKRNGKSEQDQDEIVQILSMSATTDAHAVCRLAAIETLARFEDPRAAQILITAYHNAPLDSPKVAMVAGQDGVMQAKYTETKRSPLNPISTFTPDLVSQIQMHVLSALGRNRSPAGLALLCEVASTPPKQEDKTKKPDSELFLQTSSEEGIYSLRLAALRSLANYKGEQSAIDVCYNIFVTEKPVALRSRAHESLKQLTGKNPEATPAAWAAVLGKVEAPPAKTP